MKKLLPWFVVLLILIVGFGTMYVTVQQAQRSDANWPQIQMAEDTAAQVGKGDYGVIPITGGKVDMAKSLAPFTIIYDQKYKPVAGSGYLDGKLPSAPEGILEAAKGKEYNAVTWQPQKGVRIAAVTVAADKYYVLSGRSLKEVEKNESKTLQLALLGGIISVLLLGVVFVLSARLEEY